MVGGAVHRKPYRVAGAIGGWLWDNWLACYGDAALTGTDLRDVDAATLWAVGYVYIQRTSVREKEVVDVLRKLEQQFDELAMTDEEIAEVDRLQQESALRQQAASQPPPTSKEEAERRKTAQARGAELIVPVPGLRELPLN